METQELKTPNSDKNILSNKDVTTNKLREKNLLSLFLSLFAAVLLYSFIESFWIEQKAYIITSPEIPISFDGTRIVFLTDIHYGDRFSNYQLSNAINQARSYDPDIILLGGDYVKNNPKYIQPCFDSLKTLHPPLGVFGVLGNHDHWQGADLTRESMKKAGINSIDNNAFWITKDNQRIRIGGVGDHCEDTQDLNITIKDVNTNDFAILVSHSPDYAPEITSDKIDLVLSGHTHGGQITFFGLYAPKVPSHYGQKFLTGKIILDKMQIIVSNGIGTVFLPLRFFAPPQIIIMELKSQKT